VIGTEDLSNPHLRRYLSEMRWKWKLLVVVLSVRLLESVQCTAFFEIPKLRE
jgi:hypothetical protein